MEAVDFPGLGTERTQSVAYRRTKPVFVWIAAIPILLLGASLWRRAQYRELIRMVDHTREVQAEIQESAGFTQRR